MAIEDRRPGVASAVDAGCFTIAIPNHYIRNHDLSRAHLKIESLADVTLDGFFEMVANIKISK